MSKKPSRPRRRLLEVAVASALTVLLGPVVIGMGHAALASSGRVYGAGDDVPARDVLLVLGW